MDKFDGRTMRKAGRGEEKLEDTRDDACGATRVITAALSSCIGPKLRVAPRVEREGTCKAVVGMGVGTEISVRNVIIGTEAQRIGRCPLLSKRRKPISRHTTLLPSCVLSQHLSTALRCSGASHTPSTPLLRRPSAITPTNALHHLRNHVSRHMAQRETVLVRQLRPLSLFHRLAFCEPFGSVVAHSLDVTYGWGFDLAPGNRVSEFPACFHRQPAYGTLNGTFESGDILCQSDRRLPPGYSFRIPR